MNFIINTDDRCPLSSQEAETAGAFVRSGPGEDESLLRLVTHVRVYHGAHGGGGWLEGAPGCPRCYQREAGRGQACHLAVQPSEQEGIEGTRRLDGHCNREENLYREGNLYTIQRRQLIERAG